MKRGNGGFRIFLDGVGHSDNAGGTIAGGHQHGGLALIFQPNHRLFEVAQLDVRFIEEPAAADANELVVDAAFHPAGGNGAEVGDGGNIQALVPGAGHDGLSQGVLGAGFHRRRESEHIRLVEASGGNHVGERGFAFGDGTGLVEDHGLDVLEGLNGFAGADQHPGFCAQSRTHHDGGRGSEPQGTGTGDNQYSHGRQNARHQWRQFRVYPW